MFLLFGLIVGAIARFIVPGREAGGWFTSLVVGVVGSFVGGFLGRALGVGLDGRPAGFLLSLLGAVVLLVAYHLIGRRASA
jgi:uncharacterized membrane protein YeaQ/YmgE (transglycosylase-associated protein family)